MGSRPVVVSTPGKVILAGEHAVVYGYPAIVAAIDRHLTVSVQSSAHHKRYPDLIKFALRQILRTGGPVDIKVKSNLPIGSGLGSSAALATSLVWALMPRLSVAGKNRLVKIIEDYQHGKSSGVDQTVVREGGVLKFQKGRFKKIKLTLKQAILIDSGRPKETTGQMVAMVANEGKGKILKKIGIIANQWDKGLIKDNEKLLEELGVVGNKAKRMVRQIEAIGGLAKVCGAGGVKAGSGMLLAVHPHKNSLMRLIHKNHWSYLSVKLGGSGVRYGKS
ncbi:MAG TPA: hypothetical protein VJ242_03775 [Patescibacteria group bacterium]|nr:hypothetical protein [Patescibacteria group bacterium]